MTRQWLGFGAIAAILQASAGFQSLAPNQQLAHIDVVEAKKEDWPPDLDPFTLIENEAAKR